MKPENIILGFDLEKTLISQNSGVQELIQQLLRTAYTLNFQTWVVSNHQQNYLIDVICRSELERFIDRYIEKSSIVKSQRPDWIIDDSEMIVKTLPRNGGLHIDYAEKKFNLIANKGKMGKILYTSKFSNEEIDRVSREILNEIIRNTK